MRASKEQLISSPKVTRSPAALLNCVGEADNDESVEPDPAAGIMSDVLLAGAVVGAMVGERVVETVVAEMAQPAA